MKQITEMDLENATEEYPISTVAEGMTNGGSHDWWTEGDTVKCYGSGPGWCDQSDECGCGIERAVEVINSLKIL